MRKVVIAASGQAQDVKRAAVDVILSELRVDLELKVTRVWVSLGDEARADEAAKCLCVAARKFDAARERFKVGVRL